MIRNLLPALAASVLALAASALALSAPCAWADSYTDHIVVELSTSHRVVVDDNADPALPNPDAVNSQILQTGLPMYVVNVAKDRTVVARGNSEAADDVIWQSLYDTHNPVTDPIAVNGQSHKPPLMLLVIDARGYHAKSYDVSQAIADATGPNIQQAAARHHGDLNGAVSDFVSLMAGTPSSGPVVGNEPQPSNSNPAWAWAVGVVLFTLIVLVPTVLFGRFVYRRRQEKTDWRDRVKHAINSAHADVANLAEEVLKGKDVSQAQNRATLALADADRAYEAGDIAEAASQVRIAQGEIGRAYRALDPEAEKPAHSHVEGIGDGLTHHRTKTTITATSPKGNRKTISNSDYRPRPKPGYRNYYLGGFCNDVYFFPGYYPYPFWMDGWNWSPADVTTSNEQVTAYHESAYGYGSGGSSAAFGSSGDSGHRSGGGSAAYTSSPHHHTSFLDSGSSHDGGSAGLGGFFGGGFSGGSSSGGSAGF